MKTYKLRTDINFVIIENSIVILDFSTGEFYLLDDQFLSIFKKIEHVGKEILFNTSEYDKNLLIDLCNNDILEEIC